MPHVLISALAASTLCAAASASTVASTGNPLASYLWKSRVLLVLAPDAADPQLRRQRQIYDAMRPGAAERDLILLAAIGSAPEALALRKQFGLEDSGFHAVLVGKDGGDKLSSDSPLSADDLFPLIDIMPMRQEEMRRQGK